MSYQGPFTPVDAVLSPTRERMRQCARDDESDGETLEPWRSPFARREHDRALGQRRLHLLPMMWSTWGADNQNSQLFLLKTANLLSHANGNSLTFQTLSCIPGNSALYDAHRAFGRTNWPRRVSRA